MAKEVLMPPADLLPRAGDIELPIEELAKVSLLARLSESTRKGFTRFPGAMRLRHFRRGEVICTQGDEGCTAFYILNGEDLKRLRNLILERIPQLGPEEAEQAAGLRQNLADVASALAQRPEPGEKSDAEPPAFATVQLTTKFQARPVRRQGWFERLRAALSGGRPRSVEWRPSSIPFDGPRDVDMATGQTILRDGDLFGEMACRNRRPRSATVVAQRDGYLLEFLSNILKKVEDDAAYRKEKEETYKRRVLDLHLRYLSIFRELTDAQFADVFARIRPQIELMTCESGQLLFDEHERSDSLYLVRDGLVQVKKNVTSLLATADILNWADLWKSLRSETGPGAAVARLLPAESQTLVRGKETPETLAKEENSVIVNGINDALRNRQFAQAPEFKEALASASLRERTSGMPEEKKAWSEADYRRFHRVLLEEALPKGVFRRLLRYAGPDLVLTYYSRGEFFGEMGVLEHRPRAATCIAYGQPRLDPEQKDLGNVELVRIPGEAFLALIEAFPFLRREVEREIVRRRAVTPRPAEREMQPDRTPGLFSPEGSRLGLIQGQKLMLIDLERCTRCDECVRACVDAHDDGRSRLFLLGPRFGKYLVPTTCRSCLDPVCMIGCPVRSIQRGDNREILIKDWCIGCGLCAKQCPYESIQMHPLAADETPPEAPEGASFKEVKERAVVCDLCSSLPSRDPACVYACPHEAAIRVDARREFPVS
jgi:Fe-S-cluster-containing hydrogenase component 2/CRP-like cAMP-binding protein